MISTTQFRDVAVASLRNAQALLEDASLLFHKQRYARALSLSVIGLEESGKALLYSIAALDILPDLRKTLEKTGREKNPAHDHRLKQLYQEYVSIAVWQVREYMQILVQGAGVFVPVADVDWLTELFAALIEDPSAETLTKPKKARKVWGSENTMMESIADEKKPDLEQRKQAGLYVDLSVTFGLSTPEQIGEKEAELALSDLRSSLQDFERLRRTLEAEQEWRSLANAVQQRLKKKGAGTPNS